MESLTYRGGASNTGKLQLRQPASLHCFHERLCLKWTEATEILFIQQTNHAYLVSIHRKECNYLQPS